MSHRNILVLNGHPGPTSLSKSICQTYCGAAKVQGHVVRYHDLSEMSFDADLGQSSYHNSKPLEPDLEAFVSDLKWAGHLVLATPLWWGALPAKLNGLFDRALLPGQSFDPRQLDKSGMPKPLLTGKTARVFLTSDTPSWALGLFYGNAIKKILSRQVLGFVGIKPTKFTTFAPASKAQTAVVEPWLAKVAALAGAGR